MSAASSQPSAANRASRKSGVVIPHKPKWHQRLVAWLIFASIRGVALTLRYRWSDRSEFLNQSPGPAIYCVWHNRLALCQIAYWDYVKKCNKTPGLAALVSASKDGGFLTGVLEAFGVQPVRGSSSRRGAQAMLELTTWAERGYDLAITPDGPRGPRYVVQEGAASLAQLTGLPIIPVSYNLGWKISLKSWDRFQIPLPFSRCEIIFAKPVYVPRNISDTEREALRLKVQTDLLAITQD